MALITVITPCYNQAFFLPDALRSLQEQTFQNWECIVVNDGSTDDTERVALEWSEKDSRIKYFSKQNGGLSSTRNFGLRKASGKYIQFLDADDALHEKKFQSAISLLENDDALDLVITDFVESEEKLENTYSSWCKLSDKKISYESILLEWDSQFSIPIHCALFRSTILQGLGFNEKLKAKEDWLLWLEIFKRNAQCSLIAKPYANYRHHAQAMTRNHDHMYENVYEAYKYVAENEKLGPLIYPFFHKVNAYWMKHLTKHMRDDRYRLRNEIAGSIKKVKKIFRSLVLK
ncbi:glycosyltransferase family 2 protein [Flavisolibacter ginsenosidimutans]|uniref:Glycosyltransferase family 2 protein n=1 Tax=Flavisolibacter ginsenosidimutans TaxID=661481 RepID=A0A5B8UDW2_9BACT|nr:glycosyltransferase family 2 protein [Flavisolibacter ginsenosidimutans]QEC54857.1 glycosyltransferase family 2 protein [Flavisolibacter ginsenosidimutans]